MQEGLERISLDEEIIESPIPAIQEVADDIERLLERGDVLELIKCGKFNRYIGDDASGRIPALMFWECAKYIRRGLGQNNIPTLTFIATDRKGANEKQIAELIQTFNSSDQVLIITEYLYSGKTILPLIDVLDDEKIPHKIIALRASMIIKKEEGTLLYEDYTIGDEPGTPSIYKQWELSGVVKQIGKAHSKKVVGADQHLINKAHEQALIHGRNLARRMLKKLSN